MPAEKGFNTRAVHSGELRISEVGNVTTPIFQTSTFSLPNRSASPEIDRTTEKPFLYTRMGNPTIQALEEKYASVDGAEYAAAFSSGMAAITSSSLSMADRGKPVLVLNELYGQSYHFFSKTMRELGYRVDFLNTEEMNSPEFDPAGYGLLYLESIVNPTMKVTDLINIADKCREGGVPLVVDATFASPYNQNPLKMGCTVSLHSATKYISGHSDVTMGIAGTNDRDVYTGIIEARTNFGTNSDPMQAYLAIRGLKTLGLRVKKENEVAMELAKFLEQHGKVVRVNYPGLESSPYHETAGKNLSGFGGMLSFELENGGMALKLLPELRLATAAASLGGVESLVSIPVETSHAHVEPSERRKMGVVDGLVRYSCGIEEPEDLIEDLQEALGKI